MEKKQEIANFLLPLWHGTINYYIHIQQRCIACQNS